MTVGLIRSEAAADLRTLTATGATGRTRRTLTAATAGALAFLGAPPRRCRRLSHARSDVLRQARLSRSGTGAPPRPDRRRHPCGGRRGWLALAGREPPTIAGCDRVTRHRARMLALLSLVAALAATVAGCGDNDDAGASRPRLRRPPPLPPPSTNEVTQTINLRWGRITRINNLEDTQDSPPPSSGSRPADRVTTSLPYEPTRTPIRFGGAHDSAFVR